MIPSRPADTSAEAERVQVDLLRAATVSRRLQLAWSLSATAISAARRGLARARPTTSSIEIGLHFVEIHYGATLATAVRAHLAERSRRISDAHETDLVAALRPVVEALDHLRVRHFLGGSVASSAHGVARSSLDVNVVAELESDHVDRLATALSPAYYVPIDQMRRAAAERRSFNLIHLATMFKVDVFVSKGRPFDRSSAERAALQPIADVPDEWRCRVASPEDTVLAKLEWFRLGGEISERQWWDVVGVLRVNTSVDSDYLHKWAAALEVSDLLERALADAEA